MNGIILYKEVHSPADGAASVCYLKEIRKAKFVFTTDKNQAKQMGIASAILLRIFFSLSIMYA